MRISIQEVHVQRVNIFTTEPFDTVVARIDGRSVILIWLHSARAFQRRKTKPKWKK